MTHLPTSAPAAAGAMDSLERAFLDEYLGTLGYSLATLRSLPEPEALRLMRAASLYASARLSEVENRSHLVEELHGGPHPI